MFRKSTKLSKEKRKELNISDSEYIELRKAFKTFDKDRSGFIEANELSTALKMLGENPSIQEVQEMITKADTVCEDGKVEFLEFCYLMKNFDKEKISRDEELMQLFEIIDRNKTNSINRDELKMALTCDGVTLSEEEIDATFHCADTDNDGLITFEEFKKLMSMQLDEAQSEIKS